MSDTADEGGLDKEALREELRAKYERDEREREATQRMSDLLLKGATMTNSHCGTCGDPLFRQNETTFCPTCHGGPEGVEASVDDRDTDEPTGTPASDDEPAEALSEPTDTHAPSEPTDTHPRSEPADAYSATESVDEADANSPDRAYRDLRTEGSAGPSRRTDGRTVGSRPSPPQDTLPTRSSGPTGSVDDARRALVAALERFARRGAEADDPRYARECLEAAREASEALAALDR